MKIVLDRAIGGPIPSWSVMDSVGTSLGSASDSYGLAQLGIGLVMNQNISIRPSVDIPLGLTGSNARFGMTLGYNFGSKGAPAPARRR